MRTHFVMVEVTTTAEDSDRSPSGLEVERYVREALSYYQHGFADRDYDVGVGRVHSMHQHRHEGGANNE